MIFLIASLIIGLAGSSSAGLAMSANQHPEGTRAEYYVNAAGEGQTTPITRVQIVAGKREKRGKLDYQWWQMILEKRGGGRLAVKVLSERVPLTPEAASGIGQVARYIYSPRQGECLEYIENSTGLALIPESNYFRTDLLPKAFAEARYLDGFATSGRLLGHALVRYANRGRFPATDLSSPTRLVLTSDLLIGSQSDSRDDRDESIPVDQRKDSYYDQQDYEELMAAGANYFRPVPELKDWLVQKPAFWNGQAVFPDDYYRSNYLPGRGYIDEPGIRFGWDSGVPGGLITPDIYANALTVRVNEAHRWASRQIPGSETGIVGAMAAIDNAPPSWETLFSTATYQLLGGSSGLIFEGRYVNRGYGYSPEYLLGEGLEGLDARQQFDYFHSTLRGAARRFGGFWGTSGYPEGDPELMAPAFIHAYDHGARALWFWNYGRLTYQKRLEVLKKLQEHIRAHPRDYRKALYAADVAVVLPAGYIFREDGIYGVHREELSPGGASYSDIAAAALWHGIMLSRQGVEYDTVYDSAGLPKLGYKKLIYIRESGKVDIVPEPARGSAWTPKLAVTVDASTEPVAPASRPKTLEEARPGLRPLREDPAGSLEPPATTQVTTLPVARGIKIDGRLDDWNDKPWIPLDGPGQIFCDNWTEELNLTVPEDAKPGLPQDYLGFTWDQISPEYREKYRLEGYTPDQVVVTSVRPGSAADTAGMREGDVILFFYEKNIRWAFEVWGRVDDHKKRPGKVINLKVQRGGLDCHNGPGDLSGKFSAAIDSDRLYLAADVTDDVHTQTMRGQEFWMNDCLQVGFDPLGAGGQTYNDNNHEIGFVLPDGGIAAAYRWQGRKGQPVGYMREVEVEAIRNGSRTVYEASIPLKSLTPLSPLLHPEWGMSVVVNDSDNSETRKQRLELNPRAMTAGKTPDKFSRFVSASTFEPEKLHSSIFWDKRSAQMGKSWEVTVETASLAIKEASVSIWLQHLDAATGKAATFSKQIPVGPVGQRVKLKLAPSAHAGRYRMTISVRAGGAEAARDSQLVYLYN